MKINLTEIEIRPSLSAKPEKVNMKDIVAEAVYQSATDYQTHVLAHRIGESDGEMDISPVEAAAIKRAVAGFKFYAQMPILKALGEKFD